mmetsp:Transcript_3166/g.4213  ORF Transcript_3166/g.4213 Transcript_3166/m.4213 type:complete len:384 (+) Transcript_3166:410-1561(+)
MNMEEDNNNMNINNDANQQHQQQYPLNMNGNSINESSIIHRQKRSYSNFQTDEYESIMSTEMNCMKRLRIDDEYTLHGSGNHDKNIIVPLRSYHPNRKEDNLCHVDSNNSFVSHETAGMNGNAHPNNNNNNDRMPVVHATQSAGKGNSINHISSLKRSHSFLSTAATVGSSSIHDELISTIGSTSSSTNNNWHDSNVKRHRNNNIQTSLSEYERLSTVSIDDDSENHHHSHVENSFSLSSAVAATTTSAPAAQAYGNMNHMLGMLHLARRGNHERMMQSSTSAATSSNQSCSALSSSDWSNQTSYPRNDHHNHATTRPNVNNSNFASLPWKNDKFSMSVLNGKERQASDNDYNNNTNSYPHETNRQVPSWKRQIKLQTDSKLL